jgi:hypothetical protein
VTYLVFILVLAVLAYVGWRIIQTRANEPTKRVIGPDDDPDFLWRLNRGDNDPR